MSQLFSEQELETLQDAMFFQLKTSITQKVIDQFNHLKERIQQSKIHQSFDYPIEIDRTLGKISKGENYKGLPYLILDYPRVFSKEGVFAFRTMFLWGKGCFCTFHLSGMYLDFYKKRLVENLPFLQKQGIFFYKNETDEWEHEVEFPNYIALDEVNLEDFEKWLAENNFIKIASRLDLKEIDKLEDFGLDSFEKIFFYLKYSDCKVLQ